MQHNINDELGKSNSKIAMRGQINPFERYVHARQSCKHENLHVCTEHEMSCRDVGAMCDEAWIVTEDEMYAREIAADGYDAFGVALHSAHSVVSEEAAWWEEQGHIVFIVGSAVIEFLKRKCERQGAVVVLFLCVS